ncbi:MAG TPA: hypothetical protein VID25_11685 [Candidatus Limnocylindrales bacterium]
MTDAEPELAALTPVELRASEMIADNTIRAHQALGYLTPAAGLGVLVQAVADTRQRTITPTVAPTARRIARREEHVRNR